MRIFRILRGNLSFILMKFIHPENGLYNNIYVGSVGWPITRKFKNNSKGIMSRSELAVHMRGVPDEDDQRRIIHFVFLFDN